MITEEKAVEDQEPERADGDEQSGEAGRDDALGVGEGEIASHEEKNTDDGEMGEMARGE